MQAFAPEPLLVVVPIIRFPVSRRRCGRFTVLATVIPNIVATPPIKRPANIGAARLGRGWTKA